MEKKLLAFDIDGTILPSVNAKIDSKIGIRFKKLKELGHQVIISSGRDDNQALAPLKSIDYTGYACCSNGALFGEYDANGNYNRIMCETFDPTEYIEIALKKFPDIVFLNQLEESGKYLSTDKKTVAEQIFTINIAESSKEVSIEELKKHKAVKVVLFRGPGHPGFAPDECNVLDIPGLTYSSIEVMHFLEAGKPGINKGTGLKYAADYLGIDQKNTIAFGDGSNDISMLKWANVGVAIGDRNEEVVAAADLIGKSVDENGVIPFLDEIIETGELKTVSK